MKNFAKILIPSLLIIGISNCKTTTTSESDVLASSGPSRDPLIGTFRMYPEGLEPHDGCHLYYKMKVFLADNGGMAANIDPAIDGGCELALPLESYRIYLFGNPQRSSDACHKATIEFAGYLNSNRSVKGSITDYVRATSDCHKPIPGLIKIEITEPNRPNITFWHKDVPDASNAGATVGLPAAEKYMAKLVSDPTSKQKLDCFSFEEFGPSHQMAIFETKDDNYHFVVKYTPSVGDIHYRAAVSNLASGRMFDASKNPAIALSLRANYPTTEELMEDGALVAKYDTARERYKPTQIFKMSKSNVSVSEGEFECIELPDAQ